MPQSALAASATVRIRRVFVTGVDDVFAVPRAWMSWGVRPPALPKSSAEVNSMAPFARSTRPKNASFVTRPSPEGGARPGDPPGAPALGASAGGGGALSPGDCDVQAPTRKDVSRARAEAVV